MINLRCRFSTRGSEASHIHLLSAPVARTALAFLARGHPQLSSLNTTSLQPPPFNKMAPRIFTIYQRTKLKHSTPQASPASAAPATREYYGELSFVFGVECGSRPREARGPSRRRCIVQYNTNTIGSSKNLHRRVI
jgi:hypothetical protein